MILHSELIPCPGDTWAWDYAAGDAHDQELSCDSSEMSQAHVSSEGSEVRGRFDCDHSAFCSFLPPNGKNDRLRFWQGSTLCNG